MSTVGTLSTIATTYYAPLYTYVRLCKYIHVWEVHVYKIPKEHTPLQNSYKHVPGSLVFSCAEWIAMPASLRGGGSVDFPGLSCRVGNSLPPTEIQRIHTLGAIIVHNKLYSKVAGNTFSTLCSSVAAHMYM